MKYITTTFSPAMLSWGTAARVQEVAGSDFLDEVRSEPDLVSAIGHEITAKVISALLGREVEFNRVNLSLSKGDEVFCLIPSFRATEAREFSREEVEAAGFRCFYVEIL